MEGRTGAYAEAMEQPPISRWGHTWRFVAMLAVSGAVAAESWAVSWDGDRWRIGLDLALAIVAYVVVHLRRRRPMLVFLLVTVAASFSAAAAGPAVLVTASVATRRVYWQVVVVALLSFVSTVLYDQTVPTRSDEPLWVSMLFAVAATAALLGWGMYIGSRRELFETFRQRAERAEAERDLRVGKAQADERARIAREMHDVLAHRISQISMHAGALGFRDDLDAVALRSGIVEIQVRANEALHDLRSVLGVLRDPATAAGQPSPQPTFEDLPALVADAQSAGARVEVHDHLGPVPVPVRLGRTLYRIVQEGITNAQKHAPHTVLRVELRGGISDGVGIEMVNPLGIGRAVTPGAGLGLVGLAERTQLAGGTFESGPVGSTFVVKAWLPWEE